MRVDSQGEVIEGGVFAPDGGAATEKDLGVDEDDAAVGEEEFLAAVACLLVEFMMKGMGPHTSIRASCIAWHGEVGTMG